MATKAVVAELGERLGLIVVTLDRLEEGGRPQQFGGALTVRNVCGDDGATQMRLRFLLRRCEATSGKFVVGLKRRNVLSVSPMATLHLPHSCRPRYCAQSNTQVNNAMPSALGNAG